MRATISDGFEVGLRLKPMFKFSVVNMHQAEGKIHNPSLKCGYVTLEKALSQVVQNQQSCSFLKQKNTPRQMTRGLAV